MKAKCQHAVGLLDLGFCGGLRDSEDLVVVFFGVVGVDLLPHFLLLLVHVNYYDCWVIQASSNTKKFPTIRAQPFAHHAPLPRRLVLPYLLSGLNI